MKTPMMCHKYQIYYKNRIYMHALRRCTWSSGWMSHPVLKVNRMRTMYVSGSVIHVHSDYINDSS
jgi:hypothetical protein